jgi:hypothetical protein
MNCGNWQGYREPVDLGIVRLKDLIFATFKYLKLRMLAFVVPTRKKPVLGCIEGET